MPLNPAITEIDQLKAHPALAKLLAWNYGAIEGAKFDRDEMTRIVRSIFSPTSPVLIGIQSNQGLRLCTTCCPSAGKSECD